MEKGLVSIILSVFNAASSIAASLDSILCQSYPHWELLVIDDASTDNTLALLEHYKKEDKRIKVLENNSQKGKYFNRNRGILLSTGEFITTLNQGNVFNRDKLSLQINELGIIYDACIGKFKDFDNKILEEQPFSPNTLLFRRRLIDQSGYYDRVRYGAAAEFLERIHKKNYVKKINVFLQKIGLNKKAKINCSTICKSFQQYQENYKDWHRKTKLKKLYLPFNQAERSFPLGDKHQKGYKEKIIVSMATFPARINSLKKTIDSILPWADQINIYLNEYKEVPSFLKNQSKINARVGAFDRGDTGKFFWASSIKGYHFTCDDDLIYSKVYCQTMLAAIEKYDRTAFISLHGSRLTRKTDIDYYAAQDRKTVSFRKSLAKDQIADFIGTGVMAYHTEKINVPINIFTEINMSDVFLSIYAKTKKIPLIRCASGKEIVKSTKINEFDTIYAHSSSSDNLSNKFNKRAKVNAYIAKNWIGECTIHRRKQH